MVAVLCAMLAATPTPVALLPLRSLGVPEASARALEQTLRNELSGLPEARLLGEPETVAALQREPDCGARPACAAAAARAAGAERVILGTASQLGDSYMVDLKLLDAVSGSELRRATRPVSGSRDGLIQTLRETAVELLAPQRYVGALRIDVPNAPGALLFVDGKERGKTPLAQPIELAPGQHTLRVADGKAREVSTFVEVRFGRTTEAHVDLGAPLLHSVPAPAVAAQQNRWRRPLALGLLGGSVLSLVGAVAIHARAYATAAELNRREQLNQLQPTDAAAFGDVDRDVRTARILYAAGAALGAGGGALLWWDLRGDGVSVGGRF